MVVGRDGKGSGGVGATAVPEEESGLACLAISATGSDDPWWWKLKPAAAAAKLFPCISCCCWNGERVDAPAAVPGGGWGGRLR